MNNFKKLLDESSNDSVIKQIRKCISEVNKLYKLIENDKSVSPEIKDEIYLFDKYFKEDMDIIEDAIVNGKSTVNLG